MRFARPAVSLTAVSLFAAAIFAAALVAGCGSVAAPRPDPTGDAAFVTALEQLCSKAPPLGQIDASAGATAITGVADDDNTTVNDLNAGLANLATSLSSASPLAPAITDLALMLVDTSKWYVNLVNAAKINDTAKQAIAIAARRATQARADLAKLGVTSCLN